MVFSIRAIIEVIGYPESHVNEVTQKVGERLAAESGIIISKQNISKADKVKDTIHASMIEVELKINDYPKLLHFCYDYLPSTIEILDTDKIAIPIREFTNGLNDLIAKLHQYNLTVTSLMDKINNKKPKEYKINEASPEDELDLTKEN